MIKVRRLSELKVEVSRNCPLRCLHCSSNGEPNAPERLDPHKVFSLIREFAYLGGEQLCISGGEPLCYEELSMVIRACREVNIQTAIYTTGISSNNGSLKPVSDRIVALLSESGIKFIFSLHGAHAKTHDALTQVEGSFDITMIAIEKALEAGAIVEVHVVPMTINFQEITAVTKLLVSLNIHTVSWLRFVPQGRGLLNRDALQLSAEQLRQLAESKPELQEKNPTIALRTGAPFNILCPEIAAPCQAGLSVLTIGPDGHAAPCDAFKGFKIKDDFGSILYHSLSEVWEKSYLLNEVRKIHESKFSSSCTSCHLYTRCNSGCLAQKAIAGGRLMDGKDPECLLNGVKRGCGEVKAISIC